MDKILWDEKYSVGNVEIDEQHKKLFKILRSCSNREDDSNAKYLVVVRELLSYCQDHFSREEELMRKAKYPDLSNHSAEHEKILQAVEKLVEKLYGGENVDITAINNFVSAWVKKHIIEKDLLLKDYV